MIRSSWAVGDPVSAYRLLTIIQPSALVNEVSQSLVSRRHLPSQAKVRSTTHRRGSTSKPMAASERLLILTAYWPIRPRVLRSFSPA